MVIALARSKNSHNGMLMQNWYVYNHIMYARWLLEDSTSALNAQVIQNVIAFGIVCLRVAKCGLFVYVLPPDPRAHAITSWSGDNGPSGSDRARGRRLGSCSSVA